MTLRALVAASFAVAAAACTVDGDYSGVGFACNEDQPCATGLVCVGGVCELDGPVVDGSIEDGDGGVIACLEPIALMDAFDGEGIADHWTQEIDVGTGLEQTGGVLVLTPGVSQAQPRFAAVRTLSFEFDERRLALELAQMLNVATPAIAELRLGSDMDNVLLRQTGGILQAGTTEAGAFQVREAEAFDSEAHRWWQFRVTGGELHFDVSRDGQTWTNFAAFDSGASTEFEVSIRAGTEERVTEPGSLHIDNVNSGSSLCP